MENSCFSFPIIFGSWVGVSTFWHSDIWLSVHPLWLTRNFIFCLLRTSDTMEHVFWCSSHWCSSHRSVVVEFNCFSYVIFRIKNMESGILDIIMSCWNDYVPYPLPLALVHCCVNGKKGTEGGWAGRSYRSSFTFVVRITIWRSESSYTQFRIKPQI